MENNKNDIVTSVLSESENDKDKKENGKNQNINVNLITPDSKDENEITIDFSKMFGFLKRFFAVWLAASITVAFLAVGIYTSLKKTFYVGDAASLIALDYTGANQGLDPNGNKLDITKLKSPAVIENALKDLDLNVSLSDKVRQNITITGIVPEDTMNKMSLYYDVFKNSQGGQLTAAQQLLDTSYNATEYIVKFNYFACGFNEEEGRELLNDVLTSYREYFFETYNYNEALGSAVKVINYDDYDYAEAVDIFTQTLNALEDYVTNLSQNDTTDFRSNKTGYSFSDLSEAIKVVKSIDLDRVSSYVTVNNVTKNDRATMISYYNYKIEQIEDDRAVAQSTLDSISDSIKKYETDPLILVVGENNTEDTTSETSTTDTDSQSKEVNKKYNELIQQKVDQQKKVSDYDKQINYYEDIIKNFSGKKKITQNKIDKTEDYLKTLNKKVNKLINIVNDTSDEYYSNVAYAGYFKILVPATGSESTVTTSKTLMPIIIIEGIIFVIYFGGSIVSMLKSGINNSKKKKKEN